VAKQKAHIVRDPRGRVVIERRNLPKDHGSTLVNDAYHFLRSASWKAIIAMFAGMFVATNLIFATILWAAKADVSNAHVFLDYFWFSVQSLATIGYGVLAPEDTLSNTVVTIESFLGFAFTALVTGVFFARFSTPSARVMFSKVAIIAEQGSQRTLTFRIANARATAVVEANVSVYLTRDEVLPSGERARRIHELKLRLSVQPVFALSWSVVHVIDETSPMFGIQPGDLKPGSGNLIITFHGIDDRLAQTVHTRWYYQPEDILFDERFVDIIGTEVDGTRFLDFAHFDETEPLPSAQSKT
jgi:inward rectifier potassium channel